MSRSSRREFFRKALGGAGVAALAGTAWSHRVRREAAASPFALRPPGALPERDFLVRCIKCGQCVSDCPFDTLHLATAGETRPLGTPTFDPRDGFVIAGDCTNCGRCIPACPEASLAFTLRSRATAKPPSVASRTRRAA